jgi:DUF4097 and DUF4098 domain-containing protein YvlB
MRHTFRTLMVPALLGGASVLAPVAALAAEKVLDRTFQVAPSGQLVVRAHGADVSVTGGDSDRVVVHMKAEGPEKWVNELTLKAEQHDGGVTVEMLREDGKRWSDAWRGGEGQITVTVPRGYRIDANTSGGDVVMKAIGGPSRLRTSGGDLQAIDVKGDVDADTSGGDIHLESILGKVWGRTSGGDIRATGVRGEVDVQTSGGQVRLLQIDGKIRAHTSGGSVHCELLGANRGISASTSGGDVRLKLSKDVSGDLSAESSGGSIISDLPVTTNRSDPHRLEGSINGGGERIRLHTSGGDIVLSTAN